MKPVRRLVLLSVDRTGASNRGGLPERAGVYVLSGFRGSLALKPDGTSASRAFGKGAFTLMNSSQAHTSSLRSVAIWAGLCYK